jgi:hypothetical protein
LLPEPFFRSGPRFAVIDEPDAAARPLFLMIHPVRVATPSAAAAWAGTAVRQWARV